MRELLGAAECGRQIYSSGWVDGAVIPMRRLSRRQDSQAPAVALRVAERTVWPLQRDHVPSNQTLLAPGHGHRAGCPRSIDRPAVARTSAHGRARTYLRTRPRGCVTPGRGNHASVVPQKASVCFADIGALPSANRTWFC